MQSYVTKEFGEHLLLILSIRSLTLYEYTTQPLERLCPKTTFRVAEERFDRNSKPLLLDYAEPFTHSSWVGLLKPSLDGLDSERRTKDYLRTWLERTLTRI